MRRVGAFDCRPDLGNGPSRRIHLHRVTRDVEAEFSREPVERPLRAAVRITAGDEAIFVALVSVSLAAAEARHVAKDLRTAGGKLVDRANHVRWCRSVRARGDRR